MTDTTEPTPEAVVDAEIKVEEISDVVDQATAEVVVVAETEADSTATVGATSASTAAPPVASPRREAAAIPPAPAPVPPPTFSFTVQFGSFHRALTLSIDSPNTFEWLCAVATTWAESCGISGATVVDCRILSSERQCFPLDRLADWLLNDDTVRYILGRDEEVANGIPGITLWRAYSDFSADALVPLVIRYTPLAPLVIGDAAAGTAPVPAASRVPPMIVGNMNGWVEAPMTAWRNDTYQSVTLVPPNTNIYFYFIYNGQICLANNFPTVMTINNQKIHFLHIKNRSAQPTSIDVGVYGRSLHPLLLSSQLNYLSEYYNNSLNNNDNNNNIINSFTNNHLALSHTYSQLTYESEMIPIYPYVLTGVAKSIIINEELIQRRKAIDWISLTTLDANIAQISANQAQAAITAAAVAAAAAAQVTPSVTGVTPSTTQPPILSPTIEETFLKYYLDIIKCFDAFSIIIKGERFLPIISLCSLCKYARVIDKKINLIDIEKIIQKVKTMSYLKRNGLTNTNTNNNNNNNNNNNTEIINNNTEIINNNNNNNNSNFISSSNKFPYYSIDSRLDRIEFFYFIYLLAQLKQRAFETIITYHFTNITQNALYTFPVYRKRNNNNNSSNNNNNNNGEVKSLSYLYALFKEHEKKQLKCLWHLDIYFLINYYQNFITNLFFTYKNNQTNLMELSGFIKLVNDHQWFIHNNTSMDSNQRRIRLQSLRDVWRASGSDEDEWKERARAREKSRNNETSSFTSSTNVPISSDESDEAVTYQMGLIEFTMFITRAAMRQYDEQDEQERDKEKNNTKNNEHTTTTTTAAPPTTTNTNNNNNSNNNNENNESMSMEQIVAESERKLAIETEINNRRKYESENDEDGIFTAKLTYLLWSSIFPERSIIKEQERIAEQKRLLAVAAAEAEAERIKQAELSKVVTEEKENNNRSSSRDGRGKKGAATPAAPAKSGKVIAVKKGK